MTHMNIIDIINTYDSANSNARTDPSEATLLLLYALDALRADMLEALSTQRDPEPVAGIDLSELTEAVKGLSPVATPAPGAADFTPLLANLSDTSRAQLDALKNLTTRIGAIGRGGGGGGPGVVAIKDEANNRLVVNPDGSINTVGTGAPDQRVLLDYAGRSDGNPVYVGKAPQATLESALTWVIQRLTYDSSARLTDVQILVGDWTSRAILAWT